MHDAINKHPARLDCPTLPLVCVLSILFTIDREIFACKNFYINFCHFSALNKIRHNKFIAILVPKTGRKKNVWAELSKWRPSGKSRVLEGTIFTNSSGMMPLVRSSSVIANMEMQRCWKFFMFLTFNLVLARKKNLKVFHLPIYGTSRVLTLSASIAYKILVLFWSLNLATQQN